MNEQDKQELQLIIERSKRYYKEGDKCYIHIEVNEELGSPQTVIAGNPTVGMFYLYYTFEQVAETVGIDPAIIIEEVQRFIGETMTN